MATSLFKTGSGPIATIVNYFSGGGVAFTAASLAASAANNCKELLSGAVTANTLVTVLNLSGRGRLNTVTVYTKDVTARTVRCQVVIDGATIFDATSSSVSSLGAGMVAVGIVEGSSSTQVFQGIDFNTSCVVKITQSLSETDKIAAGVNYETWQ